MIFRLLDREKTLTKLEKISASITFQVHLWTALSFLLGFAGIFRPPWLLAAAALSAILLALAARGPMPSSWPLPTRDEIRVYTRHLRWPAWLLLAMGAIAAIHFLRLGVIIPVIDYDGLSYHLGLAVHMAQDADFRHYPYESIMTSHFSRGVELLMAITIILTQSTALVNAVQWLILPPLITALYAAARALGCDRTNATIAAMITLTVPVILYQSMMAYADLFSGGWFAIALAAILGAAPTGKTAPLRILWMFSAAGLALAAKANAGILCALLGVTAIALWGWRAFFLPNRRSLGLALAAFALAASVGLPWMIRNWSQFGSPLYPFAVSVAGVEIAPGPIPFTNIRTMAEGEMDNIPLARKTWDSWTTLDFESWRRIGFLGARMRSLTPADLHSPMYGYYGDRKMGGFGALWLAALPAMLAVLALSLARLPRADTTSLRLYKIAAMLVPLLAFAALVAPWWTRFTLFLPMFGGIALALLLQATHSRANAAHAALLALVLPLAAFDWTTCIFLNREGERIRRYRDDNPAPTDAPIHFFHWMDPRNPVYNAIRFTVDNAAPGDVVAFRTPEDPLFTGFFADGQARIRLFPLPTYWPPPDTYNEQQLADAVERENITLLLASDRAAPEFIERLRHNSAREVYRVPGYTVWHLKAGNRQSGMGN